MPAQTKQPRSQAGTQRRIGSQKIEPEKDLFAWKAKGRPFRTRDREFWVRAVAIVAIGGLILFIIEGIMPVILIISLGFLFYILSTVEPALIEYTITNKGIKIAGRGTGWELLTRFWFGRRFDSELLIFETQMLPGRLELVINSKDKDAIRKALATYLPEEEAPSSNLDKAASWFSKKLSGS